MRTLGKLALIVAALVLLGSPARAQGPGALGGGPGLLLAPNVQEELNLTSDQIQTLPRTIQEVVAKHRDEMIGLRDLPPQERAKKQRELTRALNDEVKKALAISADQSRRFDQIALQQRGIEVFGDPVVQAKIMLTAAQLLKVDDIAAESRGRFQEILQSAGNDREEAIKKIRQLQKELMTKAMAELTDDQKTAWRDLSGAPFEVRFEVKRND